MTACGGGGGGGVTSAPPATAPPTAAPTASTGPIAGTSRSTIRATAQAILAAGKFLGQGGYSTGSQPIWAMGIGRLVRGARAPRATSCSSNPSGSANVSSTTDALGLIHTRYSDFYDQDCTQLERAATTDSASPSTSSSGIVFGDTTEYDRSHNVTGYATFSSTYTSTSFALQTSFSKTVGGPVIGHSGASCLIRTEPAPPTQTCGLALYTTVAGTTFGIVENVVESFTTTNNGFNTTATANVTATTYTGAGLAIVVPPTLGGTDWALSGGTQLDTITGTGAASYSGSFVTSANYSLNDMTASITSSGTVSGTSLTITLTQSGAAVATIVIDADGNGSITYADSTKETVAGYTIFG